MSKSRKSESLIEQVAGNGLLDRRALLRSSVMLAGAMGAGTAGSLTGAAAEPLAEAPWSTHPGGQVPPYQHASRFEDYVVRTVDNTKGEPGGTRARTPHQLLKGIITPNGLHFTIMHAGIPDIDPAQHKLVIHGMVKQPLMFTLDTLSRYSMVSRVGFTECGGNSAPLFSNEPIQANLQALHGLSSCAEWTGVPLAVLLDEAGVDPKAKWIIAEGADSPHLTRSVPIKKVMDDALVAMYQNGERIQPGQGYPMRLWLPGYEGNMNVKYLRRVQVTDQPAMTYYEFEDLYRSAAGRKGHPVLFRERGEILHHLAVARPRPQGSRSLRDQRHRLFGLGSHRQGHGVGGRRQELGAGGAAGAAAAEGLHPLLDAVALGRRSGHSAESRLGRGRQRPADPRAVRGRARPDHQTPECRRFPGPPFQRHHQLGR